MVSVVSNSLVTFFQLISHYVHVIITFGKCVFGIRFGFYISVMNFIHLSITIMYNVCRHYDVHISIKQLNARFRCSFSHFCVKISIDNDYQMAIYTRKTHNMRIYVVHWIAFVMEKTNKTTVHLGLNYLCRSNEPVFKVEWNLNRKNSSTW